jgi:hypothetical protein
MQWETLMFLTRSICFSARLPSLLFRDSTHAARITQAGTLAYSTNTVDKITASWKYLWLSLWMLSRSLTYSTAINYDIYHHHHHRLHSPRWALTSSLVVSLTLLLLRGGVVSLTPNQQPGGPGHPILSGSSLLTCLAWEALPVAHVTAGIALGIIRPHKPHRYAKEGIPSGAGGLRYWWSKMQLP